MEECHGTKRHRAGERTEVHDSLSKGIPFTPCSVAGREHHTKLYRVCVREDAIGRRPCPPVCHARLGLKISALSAPS